MPKEMSLNMHGELVLGFDEIPTQIQASESVDVVNDFAKTYNIDENALDTLSEAFVKTWLFYRAYGQDD